MIRRPRRKLRAFTLMEIMGLLPVLLGLTIAAYELADRVEDMQCHEAARRVDDLRVRDVVRRIQTDAALASEAAVESAPTTQPETQPAERAAETTQPAGPNLTGNNQLILRLPGRTVTYLATSEGLNRVEQIGDEPPVQYVWPLAHTQIGFQLEAAGPRSRLVWILCKTTLTFDSGPDLERRLTAVATVGRGGGQ